MNKETSERYGVFTAISLVVGIVIGSGIFFKADDILSNTNNNVLIGILGFLFVGIGVIFGAMITSQFALHYDLKEGGLVSFALQTFNEKFGRKLGFVTGWALTAIYLPALLVVISFVFTQYLFILIGVDASATTKFFMSIIVLVITYSSNIIIPKMCGGIQTVSTVLKLIPLFIIAIIGYFLSFTADEVATVSNSYEVVNESIQMNFLGVLIIIAFTFDGWFLGTSISSELKNPQRNLPIALIFGTVIVTIIYIIYFYGLTKIISPEVITTYGDAHIDIISRLIFGNIGGKIITLFVVISVYGSLNGLTMSFIRTPHALASNGLIKNVFNINKINKRFNMPVNSMFFGIIFVVIFYFIHYLSIIDGTYLNSIGFDISLLPIVLVYVLLFIIYLGIIPLIRKKIVSKIYYLYLVIALFINSIVIYGALWNKIGLIYLIISVVAVVLGYLFLFKKD